MTASGASTTCSSSFRGRPLQSPWSSHRSWAPRGASAVWVDLNQGLSLDLSSTSGSLAATWVTSFIVPVSAVTCQQSSAVVFVSGSAYEPHRRLSAVLFTSYSNFTLMGPRVAKSGEFNLDGCKASRPMWVRKCALAPSTLGTPKPV